MARPKRGKQFVDRQVQGALIKRAVLHWSILLFGTLLLLFGCQVLIGGPFQPLSNHLQAVWFRYGPFLVVLLAFVPAAIWDFVKLSNRFAGPMIRFRRNMHKLALGEPVEPMHFRPGDFWQDLAEDFNAVLKRIPADSPPAESPPAAEAPPEANQPDRTEEDTESTLELTAR